MKPSKRQRALLTVASIVLVSIWLGIWGTIGGGFVPSADGDTAIFFLAVMGAVLVFPLGLRKPDNWLDKVWMKRLVLRAALAMVLPSILAFSVYMGIGWSSAAAFGKPGDRVVTVADWRDGSYRLCEGPNLVEAPMNWSVCLGDTWKVRLPPGTKFIISGRQTVLGMNVTTFRTIAGT